jgi:hypothetical protein
MSKKSKQSKPPVEEGTAEGLITSDNSHWNGYALQFLVTVKESNLFPSEDIAMGYYQDVIELIVEKHDKPLDGDHGAAKLLEGLSEAQRLIIYQGAYEYLKNSSYGGEEEPIDLTPAKKLLRIRTKEAPLPRWSTTAKDSLRDLVRKELDALPSTLEQLDPKDRVAVLCKLIPFVMGKGEEVPPPSITW